MWTVPRGWTGRVVCENRGPLRHACGVVEGAHSGTAAFPAAGIAVPQLGLEAGRSARFSFRASRKGVFRFACLVPGHETARMWDVLKVVRRGRPSVGGL